MMSIMVLAIRRGTETYSQLSTDIIQCREISKRLDAGQKKIGRRLSPW